MKANRKKKRHRRALKFGEYVCLAVLRDGKFCDGTLRVRAYFTGLVGTKDAKSGQYQPVHRCEKHKPKEVTYWDGQRKAS